MARKQRTLIVVFVLLDLLVLSAATAWMFWPKPSATSTAAAGNESAAPNGAPAGSVSFSASGSTSNAPTKTTTVAAPLTLVPPRRINGGPKFVTSGIVDRYGNTWLGSEGEGVWCLRDNNWRHFGVAEGLPSDDVTALGCDKRGRVWVGHSAGGVSIYNGQAWKIYDRFSGVGGSHISAIACNPADGDVWLGTESGLTRYSATLDSWTNPIRGLDAPNGVATGIAFDSTGRAFVTVDDGGVAMAGTADGYKTWRSVTGPETMPVTETGVGLPSRLANAVQVMPDDTIFVGSTRGISRSADHGAKWEYIRGKFWPTLAAGRYDGVPADFKPVVKSGLASDWVTALASDGGRGLWIGYRSGGYQYFPNPDGAATYSGKGSIRTILQSPFGGCVFGTYGDGVWQHDTPAVATTVNAQTGPPAFPASAAPPSVVELDNWRQRLESLPAASIGVDVLDDDWETTGNWCGRYGSLVAQLRGLHDILNTPGYSVGLTTGPFRKAAMRYYWVPGDKDRYRTRGLLDVIHNHRAFCENNDESYDTNLHPTSKEGPDLYVRVIVPTGVHRVSLYFHNSDGHGRAGSERDFTIDVKRYNGNELAAAEATQVDEDAAYYDADRNTGGNYLRPASTIEPELAPSLAHTRVPNFYCGVWKRFLVRGAGTYWFKIGRNHSQATKVQGVFIDRLDAPVAHPAAYPKPPPVAAGGIPEAAAKLWAAADAAVGKQDYARLGAPARIAAYRAAVAGGATPEALAAWRWTLCAWEKSDTAQFAAFEATLPPSTGER